MPIIPAWIITTVMSAAIASGPSYFHQSAICGTPTPVLFYEDSRVFGRTGPDCGISINASKVRNLNDVCKATLHEYGHLVGLGHSPDPRSVMHSPYFRSPLPRICGGR